MIGQGKTANREDAKLSSIGSADNMAGLRCGARLVYDSQKANQA
jgi:hypothetical protein